MPDSKTLYIKCLKYPLALFYGRYDSQTQTFGIELFKAFLHLDTLRHIERIGYVNLTADEKKLGDLFVMHHVPGTTAVLEVTFDGGPTKMNLLHGGTPCSLFDLETRYKADSCQGGW